MNQDLCRTNADTMNFSCIADADQLCALFQNTPAADRRYERIIKSFLLFHMHVHVAASPNRSTTSSHLEDKCCEASDTQDTCRTTAVYSRAIFEYSPYPLLKLFLISTSAKVIHRYFTSGVTSTALDNTIEEICWTPPYPFCSNTDIAGIVQNIIFQVKNHDVACIIYRSHAKTSLNVTTCIQYNILLIILYYIPTVYM